MLDDFRWEETLPHRGRDCPSQQCRYDRRVSPFSILKKILPVPEEFRFIPFLVYDYWTMAAKRCAARACGICAKVCPPQCIWITRKVDAKRPVNLSQVQSEFYIDIDICMNCGFCAEYCPFDAINMDHDYEIASYDRIKHHIYDMEKLAKPVEYYASIRPTNYRLEEDAKAAKAAAKLAAGQTPS